jgi:hypothetical protein
VVATGLPALERVDGVELVEGVDEALAAIEGALRADSPGRRRARSDAVRQHSWEARLDEIAAALRR